MSSIKVNINIPKILDSSESLRPNINKETLLLMINSFSKYISALYEDLLEESIYSSKYKGSWEPVEEEGYKEYIGVEPTGYILYYIKEALEVKKIGNNLVLRISPKEKYPGSDIPLSRVVKAIDSGTSKFNARPIIGKINREIESNIVSLWRGYLTIKRVV